MDEKIKIYCKNNQKHQEFRTGVSLLEIYQAMDIQLSGQVMCAAVNNKMESLQFVCYKPKDIEFIGMDHPSGMRTYVRSLCFILAKAIHDLFPKRKLYFEHALSKGYYCKVENDCELTSEDVECIKKHMQEIIAADVAFIKHERPTTEVIDLFRQKHTEDKALLLQTVGEAYSTYYSLDDYVDYFYGYLLPSTGWIYLFDIEKSHEGVLLRIPNRTNLSELEPYVNQEKMFAVFQDLRVWQKAVSLSNVGELNRSIQDGTISTSLQIAEVLQERKIAKIADDIFHKVTEGVRVVLIAGPSSSGKTTFCKRLQLELMASTLHPVSISLDDYYVNRIDTPLDENGEYDYESLYAIDLETFNEDLQKVLAGEKVPLPTYDFQKGERVYRGNTVQLDQRSILVMEGIHGMNPLLVPHIPAEKIYKIYVSALTSISLDDHNWIPTTDNRLIRRIVRDYQFRGYSAKETISRWASVRKGEDKWIFPYQENADAMFNSAMLYELAALRKMAEPILKEVTQMDEEYPEAYRLLKFLHYFKPIDKEALPNTSLLREFVGGSSFCY